jgi:hypothetical protein
MCWSDTEYGKPSPTCTRLMTTLIPYWADVLMISLYGLTYHENGPQYHTMPDG